MLEVCHSVLNALSLEAKCGKTTSHTDLIHCAMGVMCITYHQSMGLGSLSYLGSVSTDGVRAKSGVLFK